MCVTNRSGAKPSQFAYPPNLEEKKDKHKEKVETAILSTTARAKRKEKKDIAKETRLPLENKVKQLERQLEVKDREVQVGHVT